MSSNDELKVFPTEFGKPGFELLRERLTYHKTEAPHPFAPVTIITPPGQALTSISFGASQGQNLAGINYTTFSRLAGLAVDSVGTHQKPHKPASQLQKIAVLRSLIGAEPENLLDDFMVEDSDGKKIIQPSNESVLLHILEKLEYLAPQNLKKIQRLHPEVLKIFEAYLEALDKNNLSTSFQFMQSAVDLYRGESNEKIDEELNEKIDEKLDEEIGPVLTYLTEPLFENELELLQAFSIHTPVEIIACLTGNSLIDEEMNLFIQQITSLSETSPSETSETPLAAAPDSKPGFPNSQLAPTLTSYPSPIEEVRAIRSEIYEELKTGTPPHQMAVLYTTANPYQQLLLDLLDESGDGLPVSMQTGRTLQDSIAGRALEALLDIAENGYSRDAVNKLFEAKLHNKHLQLAEWKHIVGAARIPAGDENWAEKKKWEEGSNKKTREILDFLKPIFEDIFVGTFKSADKLDAGQSKEIKEETTWETKTQILKKSLDSIIGSDTDFAVSREKSALTEIQNILTQASELDGYGDSPDLPIYTETIRSQLARQHGRQNRFGRGIFVGHISQAQFLDLSHIWIVGLADGVFPGTSRLSPVISFADWEKLAEDQPSIHRHTLNGLAKAERRCLIAAMQSAGQQVSLLFPRVLDSQLSGISGEPTYLLEELNLLEPDNKIKYANSRLEELQIGNSKKPASIQEYNLTALSQEIEPDSTIFQRAKELLEARASYEFTPFDGFVSNFEPDSEGSFSATQLEHFTKCPQGYFFKHVLKVKTPDYSEPSIEISALEKGNLIHKILEKFYNEHKPLKAKTASEKKKELENGQELLEDIAYKEFSNKFGDSENNLSAIRQAQLDGILDNLKFIYEYFLIRKDLENEANEKTDEFKLRLNDSKEISLKVRIDRIDKSINEGIDNKTIIALDYKTGKMDSYKKLSKDNPLNHWANLQHFIYAMYLLDKYREYDAFQSGYLFSSKLHSTESSQNPIILELDTKLQERLTKDLAEIIDLLEQGIFPPGIFSRSDGMTKAGKTTKHSCNWCDPDKPANKYGLQNLDLHEQLLQKKLGSKPLSEILYPAFTPAP